MAWSLAVTAALQLCRGRVQARAASTGETRVGGSERRNRNRNMYPGAPVGGLRGGAATRHPHHGEEEEKERKEENLPKGVGWGAGAAAPPRAPHPG